MYTMRLEPAEDQNIFIKAKKEGYVTLTPPLVYKMSKRQSQKIVLSLSPDLGVRWQGCRQSTDFTIDSLSARRRQSGGELGQCRLGLEDRQDGCKLTREIGVLLLLGIQDLLPSDDTGHGLD